MRRAFVIVGLGFGDEGKGTTVDATVREFGASLVVRYNGGGQAAHNVVTPDGRHHTFAQFGSGTFQGARTHLSHKMVVNPPALAREAESLQTDSRISDPYALLTVDSEALVTTPFHIAMNKVRERSRAKKGEQVHGSTGMGVGETVKDSLLGDESIILRVKDLYDRPNLRKKLERIQEFKVAEASAYMFDNELDVRRTNISFDPYRFNGLLAHYEDFAGKVQRVDSEWLASELLKDQTVVFEGAQGILLDEKHGFHPHTTWSNTTTENVWGMLPKDYSGEIRTLGILRAFHTRHGAGPFVTEDPSALGLISHDHNTFGEFQHSLRAGPFDLAAAEYAIGHVGTDRLELVMTNLDRLDLLAEEVPYCWGYRDDTDKLNPELFYRIPYTCIYRMRVLHQKDLERQERLANALRKVTPELTFFSLKGKGHKAQTEFAEAMAKKLKLPLAMTSHGPTHTDKFWR